LLRCLIVGIRRRKNGKQDYTEQNSTTRDISRRAEKQTDKIPHYLFLAGTESPR
jgi:hypothetical protein